MEWRTLSSSITSKEGSSKVIVSGATDVRYVSNGLITLGHIPSESKDKKKNLNRSCYFKMYKNSIILLKSESFTCSYHARVHPVSWHCEGRF